MPDNLFAHIGTSPATSPGTERNLFDHIGQPPAQTAPEPEEPSSIQKALGYFKSGLHSVNEAIAPVVGAPKNVLNAMVRPAAQFGANIGVPYADEIASAPDPAAAFLRSPYSATGLLERYNKAALGAVQSGAESLGLPGVAKVADAAQGINEGLSETTAGLMSDPLMYTGLGEGKIALAGAAAFTPGMVEGAIEHGGRALDPSLSLRDRAAAGAQALVDVGFLGHSALSHFGGKPETAAPAVDPAALRAAEADLGTLAQNTPRVDTVPANPDILEVLKRDAAGRQADDLIAQGLPSERQAADVERRSAIADALQRAQEDAARAAAGDVQPRERTPLPTPPPALYGPDGNIIQPFVPVDPNVLQRLRDANASEVPPIPRTPGTVPANPNILDVLRQANTPPEVWQGDTPPAFEPPTEMRSPDEVRADMLAEVERQRAAQPVQETVPSTESGQPAPVAAPSVFDQLTSQEQALLAHTGFKGRSSIDFSFKSPEAARDYLRPLIEAEKASRAKADATRAGQTPGDGRMWGSLGDEAPPPPKGEPPTGGAPPAAAAAEVPFDVPAAEPLKGTFGETPEERQDYVDTVLLNAKKFGNAEGPGDHVDPVDGSRWLTHVQDGEHVAAARIGTDNVVSDWVGKEKGHGALVARRIMRTDAMIDPEHLSPESAAELNEAMARGGRLGEKIRSRILDRTEPGADVGDHDVTGQEADSVPGPDPGLAGREAPDVQLPERSGGTERGGHPATEGGVRSAGGEGSGELGRTNLHERRSEHPDDTLIRSAVDSAVRTADRVDESAVTSRRKLATDPALRREIGRNERDVEQADLGGLPDDPSTWKELSPTDRLRAIKLDRALRESDAAKDGRAPVDGLVSRRLKPEADARYRAELDALREKARAGFDQRAGSARSELATLGQSAQRIGDQAGDFATRAQDYLDTPARDRTPEQRAALAEEAQRVLDEREKRKDAGLAFDASSSRYNREAAQRRIASAEGRAIPAGPAHTVAVTTPEMEPVAKALAARPDVIVRLGRATQAMASAAGVKAKLLGLTTEGVVYGHQNSKGVRLNPLSLYEAAIEHLLQYNPKAVQRGDRVAIAKEMARRAARTLMHEVAHYVVEDHGPEHDVTQRKMIRALSGKMADVRTSLTTAFMSAGKDGVRYVDLMGEHLGSAQEHWKGLERERSAGDVRGAGGAKLVEGGREGGEPSAEARVAGKAGPPEGVRAGRGGSAAAVPARADVGGVRAQERAPEQPVEPFYSALQRAAESKIPAKGAFPPGDVLKSLQNVQGVKADEIKWTGLDEFLSAKAKAGQKVTRQEVTDFLRENAVTVKEVTKGGADSTVTVRESRGPNPTWQIVERDGRVIASGYDSEAEARAEIPSVTDHAGTSGDTKFSSYTIPGGKNYREVLLTLPGREHGPDFLRRAESAMEWEFGWRTADGRKRMASLPGQLSEAEARAKATKRISEGDENGYAFRSSHFDEPNILAHLRLNDRTDADGKRVLFVEEAQSDWAQKGRREGFKGDPSQAQTWQILDAEGVGIGSGMGRTAAEAMADFGRVSRQRPASARPMDVGSGGGGGGVPRAPFIDSTEKWTNLALKRVLRMAAEDGYDRVAWTTGEQQAARYDLSKQVDEIVYYPNEDGTVDLQVGKGGNVIHSEKGASLAKVEETVGKEIAQKIGRGEGAEYGEGKSLSGLDLKVGGEGMKGYYDKIVPAAMDKLAKKWGAKSGQASMPGAGGKAEQSFMEWLRERHPDRVREGASSRLVAEFEKETLAATAGQVHSIDVTPAMRRSVLYEGQPLFHERRPIRPIPPTAKPPMGRPMEPGEAHRVDRKVADLEAASPADEARLSRNAPRTWESLDPKIQKAIDAATETPKAQADFYTRARSGRLNDVEVQALDGMVRGARESMESARTALEKAQKEGRDTGPENVAVLRAALDQSVNDFAKASRSDVEAGTKLARALAARARVMEAAGRSTPEQFLREVFKKMDGVTDEQAAALVHKMQTDPGNLLDTLQGVMRSTTSSRLIEAWKQGLISAPGTQIANIMGNLAEVPVRLAETVVASALDSLGGNGTRLKGEAGHELRGAWTGAMKGLDPLLKELSDIAHLRPEKITPSNLEHIPAIPGKTGRAIRTPGRILEAADQFFQSIGHNAELYKLALREAKGNMAEAQRLIDKPPKAMREAAEASALSRTYKDPNKLAEVALRLRASHPAMHVILPFVVTPANIARLAFERTPAGFVKGIKALNEYNRAVKSGADAATVNRLRGYALDTMARPILGSAIMGTFFLAAKSGLMTGSGPTDQKEKNLLLDSGWQPYSFALPIGENGKRVYVPYNRLEPVSSLLGIAADMAEIQDQRKLGDMADKALGSIGSNFLSKTFLTGLSDAANAIARPQEFASQYVSNLAGSVVPNIVAKGAQAIDPTIRDTRPTSQGIVGIPERAARSIGARLPGVSKSLPARQTALGDDAQRQGNAVTRFLLPSQVSADKEGVGDLEKEMSRVGFVPGGPSRTLSAHGQKVELTDDEFVKLQSAYRRAADYAERLLQSPAYKSLPDTVDEGGTKSKEKMLRDYFDKIVGPVKAQLARKALLRSRAS